MLSERSESKCDVLSERSESKCAVLSERSARREGSSDDDFLARLCPGAVGLDDGLASRLALLDTLKQP